MTVHYPGMNRRRFLVTSLAGVIAAPLAAEAQRPAKLPTLGLLYPNPSSKPKGAALDFFSARLKKRGWIVGETVALENASAEGREDRLPALAEALVAKRVDVIWAAGPEATVAARATKTIPPGLASKRLELLKRDAAPTLTSARALGSRRLDCGAPVTGT